MDVLPAFLLCSRIKTCLTFVRRVGCEYHSRLRDHFDNDNTFVYDSIVSLQRWDCDTCDTASGEEK